MLKICETLKISFENALLMEYLLLIANIIQCKGA